MPANRAQRIAQPVSGLLAPAISNILRKDISLVFHTLVMETLNSTFVSRGIGDLTEARTSTIYLPDDAGIWQSFGSGIPGRVYAGGKWWL